MDKWKPEYHSSRGVPFTVDGVDSTECPVSAITPETKADLEAWWLAKRMKESSGAAAFGPDLSRWPARDVDAWGILQGEEQRFEDARTEAERP